MIYAKIHNLTLQYKNDKAMLDNLKKIKSILPHNQQIAVEMINKLEKK